jgi:hypothetical protein
MALSALPRTIARVHYLLSSMLEQQLSFLSAGDADISGPFLHARFCVDKRLGCGGSASDAWLSTTD